MTMWVSLSQSLKNWSVSYRARFFWSSPCPEITAEWGRGTSREAHDFKVVGSNPTSAIAAEGAGYKFRRSNISSFKHNICIVPLTD